MQPRSIPLFVLCGLAAVPSPSATDDPLVLRAEVTQETVNLDDIAECRLVIGGSEVAALTASLPGGVVSQRAPDHPAFVYTFDFKPSKVGMTTLGPFRLQFHDEKLVSNALAIRVVPAPDDPSALRLFGPSSSVHLGSSFELTTVLLSKLITSSPTLKSIGNARIGMRRTAERTTKEGWKSVTTYRITPVAEGMLRFNSASFSDLPPDVAVPELTVEVLP